MVNLTIRNPLILLCKQGVVGSSPIVSTAKHQVRPHMRCGTTWCCALWVVYWVVYLTTETLGGRR